MSVIFEKISKYEPQREVIKDAASQSPSRLGLIRPKSNQTAGFVSMAKDYKWVNLPDYILAEPRSAVVQTL